MTDCTPPNIYEPALPAQQQLIELLAGLVAIDTQNPPKNLSGTREIFEFIKQRLTGFEFFEYQAANNSRSLLALRGHTDLLFNIHIDTVPVSEGWLTDPLTLKIDQNKITGLGACDIKGAAAALIWAAQQTEAPVAILFSNDEEHGRSEAIHHFLAHKHPFTKVLVAEPTCAKAVAVHRGINTGHVTFLGKSGHASNQKLLKYSAIHLAIRWCDKVMTILNEEQFSFHTLEGIPFNLGTIKGGIKANMIADHCEINFGCRTLPGFDIYQKLNAITQAYFNPEEQAVIQIAPGFAGPPLPATTTNVNDALEQSNSLIKELGLPPGPAVNFWTEASLFSAAGMTTLVYGPGDIEQAHTANEWVSKSQLFEVAATYQRMINHYHK